MAGQTFLQSLKDYVGFTDASSALLREMHPLAAPHLPAIIDDFYATIEAHPGARAVITGGHAQIERLKETLRGWITTLLLGPHDEAYFETRARIGRVHVRIDLPQAYMFTAMDRIRVRLLDVARDTLAGDPARLCRTAEALHQILDIELAIMLETYREDMMAKNRVAERLATIGQFAAGIGHELRNPLGVMESSTFLIRQQLKQIGVEDAKVDKHLDKITAEVKRSNKTINDLLELARNRPPRRKPTDLAGLVAASIEAAALSPGVEVSTEIPGGAVVEGDADQLRQVLVNLLTNAAQAMSDKGHIWIEASRSGGESHIRIRDDGPGVPGEVRHRIFEALFTTKAKGSGLGLALCQRIAEAHGGTVKLEQTAKGASFLVRIPDADSSTEGRATS